MHVKKKIIKDYEEEKVQEEDDHNDAGIDDD